MFTFNLLMSSRKAAHCPWKIESIIIIITNINFFLNSKIKIWNQNSLKSFCIFPREY